MHYIKMAALLSVPLSMNMKAILQKRTREVPVEDLGG